MSERPVHGCPLASWQHAWIHGVLSSTCSCIGMSFITAVEGHYQPVEGGRGGTATGGLPGTVALARSIVTPYAPFMRRCMGSRTPCCATTGEPLAGKCLWSSCVLLLCQDLLWCRAIPIPTGCALVIG